MARKAQHPWPTDGVTTHQLNKQMDRVERLYEHRRKEHVALKARVTSLEATVRRFTQVE